MNFHEDIHFEGKGSQDDKNVYLKKSLDNIPQQPANTENKLLIVGELNEPNNDERCGKIEDSKSPYSPNRNEQACWSVSEGTSKEEVSNWSISQGTSKEKVSKSDGQEIISSDESSNFTQTDVLDIGSIGHSNAHKTPESDPPDFWVSFDEPIYNEKLSSAVFPAPETQEVDSIQYVPKGTSEGADMFGSVQTSTSSTIFDPMFPVKQSDSSFHASKDVISPTFLAGSETCSVTKNDDFMITNEERRQNTGISATSNLGEPVFPQKPADNFPHASNDVTSPTFQNHPGMQDNTKNSDFKINAEGNDQNAEINAASSSFDLKLSVNQTDSFLHASEDVFPPKFHDPSALDLNIEDSSCKTMNEGKDQCTVIGDTHQNFLENSENMVLSGENNELIGSAFKPTFIAGEHGSEFGTKDPGGTMSDKSLPKVPNSEDTKLMSSSSEQFVSFSDKEMCWWPESNQVGPSVCETEECLSSVSCVKLETSAVGMDKREISPLELPATEVLNDNRRGPPAVEEIGNKQEMNHRMTSIPSTLDAAVLHAVSDGFTVLTKREQDSKVFDKENKKGDMIFNHSQLSADAYKNDIDSTITMAPIAKEYECAPVEEKPETSNSSLPHAKERSLNVLVDESDSQIVQTRTEFQDDVSNGKNEEQKKSFPSGILLETSQMSEVACTSLQLDPSKGSKNLMNLTDDFLGMEGDELKYPEPALWEQLLEEELTVPEEGTNSEALANATASSNPFTTAGSTDILDMFTFQQEYQPTSEQSINNSAETEGVSGSSKDASRITSPDHPTTTASQSSASMQEQENSYRKAEIPVQDTIKDGSEHHLAPRLEIDMISDAPDNPNLQPSRPSKNPFDKEHAEESQNQNFHAKVPSDAKDSHTALQSEDSTSVKEKSEQESGLSWKPILSFNRTNTPAQMMTSVWNSPAKLPSQKAEKQKGSIKSLWKICSCCAEPAT